MASYGRISVKLLAIGLGRSKPAIRIKAFELGLTKFHTWTAQQDEMLVSLWNQGYMYKEIGHLCNTSANSARHRLKYLRKHGYKTPGGEAPLPNRERPKR